MTLTSNADFAKRMLLLARPAAQFAPTATYDPDGDCIEFLAKPDPFYGVIGRLKGYQPWALQKIPAGRFRGREMKVVSFGPTS